MSRQSFSMVFSLLVLAVVAGSAAYGFDANTDPSLVGWWKLDDGAGTIAVDSSPGGHDGTLTNGPVWTSGYYGGGLEFDGTDDYVDTGWTDNLPTWTISVWVISPAAPSASEPPSGPLHRENNYQFNWNHNNGGVWPGSVAANVGGWNATTLGPLEGNTWYFLAGTFDGTELKAYTNGELISTLNFPGTPASESNSMKLGRHAANAQYFGGTVDDARVYDRALTIEEIQEVMTGGTDPALASTPMPVNEATDVPRDVVLGWAPGEFAATHDVYFGTVFDDVNTAGRTNPKGVLASQGQTAVTYDPDGPLAFGQTYYWRVDEVNAPPTATIFKGDVWSFTTEPRTYPVANVIATASIPATAGSEVEKIVDGSGLTAEGGHSIDATAMWQSDAVAGEAVSLQFEFDRVYKLDGMRVWNYNHQYEMFLRFSLQDVTVSYSTDANEWTPLGDYAFTQGTGLPTLAYQAIDFGGVAAKYVRFDVQSNYGGSGYGLSEVQFNYLPVSAREPQPAPGATDVNPSVVLSWRPGREAVSHEVYLSADSNAVANDSALVDTTAQAGYDTSVLDLSLSQTYYWKITEVNEAAIPASWASDIWDFNTPDFIVVDDFESYNDEEGTRVFDIWIDGYGIAANGSLVGHENPPYAEETTVHSGAQSLPFYYGVGGATASEAELTLPGAQDWTRAGAQTLVLYFCGNLGNATGQLYLKVNGTPVNYDGSAGSLAAPVWKQWNIDLASLGNAAGSARTVTIGVSGSGSGLLYIDDIRLYKSAAPMTGPAVDPGAGNLVALYAMEDNVSDGSGNGRDGTAQVGSSFGQGPAGYGRALVLDGTSGHADLPIGSLIQSLSSTTVATWANWSGTGSWQRLFDFGIDTDIYMFVTPNSGSGTLRFAITTTSGTGESIVEASPGLTEGWHHVAVTIDGATAEMGLYLDGLLVGSVMTETLPMDLGNTTQNWIGRSQYEADAYFNGSVDDFRIYNRALSEAEVRYLVGDR